MYFLRRWLSHSVRLGLALFLALAAMQAPAFTADYAASLLQVSDDARRDVDQREASARQYYAIPPGDDTALIAGLSPHEPSNAATLALSLDRVVTLRNARDRILASGALLQPLAAFLDATHDPQGYKAAIWRTQFQTYTAHLDLSVAAIVYGAAGLALGSLIGHLLFAPFDRTAARRLAP